MFKQAAAIAGLALLGSANVEASPLPQATLTVVAPPPGAPNATYVQLGVGAGGDVTLVAERPVTLSGGSATTVFDALDVSPTQLAIVEAGADGAILQAINCEISANGTEVCAGALVNNGTTEAYVFSGAGMTATVTAEGISALPTDILSILPSFAANAFAFSSAVQSITAISQVTALPGFVGQSSAAGNMTSMAANMTATATDMSSMASATSMPASAASSSSM